MPQLFGQFNHLSVAEAMHMAVKLTVLHEILDGTVTEANLTLLNDDWQLGSVAMKYYIIGNLMT